MPCWKIAMFGRHSLVWPSGKGWQAARANARDDARDDAHAAIEAWGRAGRPAVVRRADPDAGEDLVCAGIALPPDASGGKQRIALRIPAMHIRKASAPIRLEDAMPAMPRQWQPALASLAAAAGERQLSFRVYGSAALQSLTGLTYVTAASDIDLLFHPASRAQLDAGLDLLAAHAGILPLDGEVVFPCGGAVAWKEWMTARDARSNPRVLVKDNRHVRLLRTDDLQCNLKDEPCTSR